MVNAGPVKICEIFLDPIPIKNKTYVLGDTKRLVEALIEFVRTCGKAVNLNHDIMEEKHAKFTDMIEKAYKTMKEALERYIENAQKAIAEIEGA